MVHADGPVGPDGIAVCSDDERAVADAGVVLTATVARRLRLGDGAIGGSSPASIHRRAGRSPSGRERRMTS